MAIPKVTTNNILEILIKGHSAGQAVINRFNMRCSAHLTTGAGLDEVGAAIGTRWDTNILPLLNQEYVLDEIIAKVISGSIAGTPTATRPHPATTTYSAGYAIGYDPAFSTGGVGTDPLPNAVTVSIKKVTTRYSRFYKGGLHLGTLSEADTSPDGNYLSSAAGTAFQAAIVATLPPAGFDVADVGVTYSSTLIPCVFSAADFAWGGYVLPTPVDATADVTSWVVNSLMGVQVSRKPRSYYP